MFLRAITSFAAALSTTTTTLTNCGQDIAKFQIQSMNLDPAEPVAGGPLMLNLNYVVPPGTLVTGGIARYDFTYNFIPFDPTTEPLCQNIPCPMSPGRYMNSSKSTWPSGLNGIIGSKMSWFDQNSELLLCIEINSMSERNAANEKAIVLVGSAGSAADDADDDMAYGSEKGNAADDDQEPAEIPQRLRGMVTAVAR